jgi:hypothetical protein
MCSDGESLSKWLDSANHLRGIIETKSEKVKHTGRNTLLSESYTIHWNWSPLLAQRQNIPLSYP